MRYIRAVLYKDFKLFFGSTGIVVSLLPFALVIGLFFLLQSAGEDLLASIQVKPFPISIRDEDNTLMSRSLTSQVRDVDLFSKVYRTDGETDEELLDAGYVAVTTIPKDFFYEMYVSADCPAKVVLNENRPVEAALYRAVFTSVMDVVRSDQAAVYGGYTFVYGTLSDEQRYDAYAAISAHLFRDLLGRQRIFDEETDAGELAGVVLRRLLATVLSVLILFYMTASAKTIPEEHRLSVIGRFQAIGGPGVLFAASRFFTALLFLFPAAALCAFLFPATQWTSYAAVVLFAALCTYVLVANLAALWKSAGAVQRTGNLFLLLSLTIGATLWPENRLPSFLKRVREFTLPFRLHRALEALAYEAPLKEVLSGMLPLAVLTVLCVALRLLVAAVMRMRRARAVKMYEPENTVSDQAGSVPDGEVPAGSLRPVPVRMLALSVRKLLYISGGGAGLAAILAVMFLTGAASAFFTNGAPYALSVAVVDEDDTEASKELIARIAAQEGISVSEGSAAQGRGRMADGESEGILVIGEGYADYLTAQAAGSSTEQTKAPLHYESAHGVFSAQGAREIIAAQAGVLRSFERAKAVAGQLRGEALLPSEEAKLRREIEARERDLPALYQISFTGSVSAADPFTPGQTGFALMALLFCLMTGASAFAAKEHLHVTYRMQSMRFRALLSSASDALAVFLLGLLSVPLLMFLGLLKPDAAGLMKIAACCVFAFTAGMLSLFLTRLSAGEGRMDGLAPLVALALSLLGGCFMDVSVLPDRLLRLGNWLPTRLGMLAAAGDVSAVFLLLSEGVVCYLLYRIAGKLLNVRGH